MSETIYTVGVANEALSQWIEKSNFSPGEKLPSERDLCHQLNVKRMTLRQALLNLESESRIFRKDRRGWFITPARFIYSPNSSSSFSISAEAQNREPTWGYLTKEQIQDYEEGIMNVFFQGEKKPVYMITGWGALEGHKVFYHETYINPEYAPDYISHMENESLQSLWKHRFSQDIKTKELTFRPVRISGAACKQLGCAAGSPAILVRKHRSNENGVVVHIDIEYWRFESVDFMINL